MNGDLPKQPKPGQGITEDSNAAGNSSKNLKIKIVWVVFFVSFLVALTLLIFFVNHSSTSPMQTVKNGDGNIQDDSPVVAISRGEWDGINTQYWASKYYFNDKDGKIYYWLDAYKDGTAKEVVGADPSSFSIIFSNVNKDSVVSYAKDRSGIYCDNHLQKNIDLQSFILLSKGVHSYGRDKNTVYIDCKSDSRFDPTTFEVISFGYTRDKNGVYSNDVHLTVNSERGLTIIGKYFFNKNSNDLFSLTDQRNVGKTSYSFSGESNGRISLSKVNFQISDDVAINMSPYKESLFMIFESSSTPETSIVSFPSPIQQKSAITIYRNKAFFTYPNGNSGSIGIFDFSTNKSENIDILSSPLVDNFEKSLKITDYFVDDSNLYILLGTNGCGEYLAKCKTDLYQYDLEKDVLQKIYDGLSSYVIIGLNKSKDTIGLRSTFGDAGLWSKHFELIDLKTRTKTEKSFGGMESNDASEQKENAQQYQQSSALEDLYTSSWARGKNMNIKDGFVMIPEKVQEDSGEIRFIFAN